MKRSLWPVGLLGVVVACRSAPDASAESPAASPGSAASRAAAPATASAGLPAIRPAEATPALLPVERYPWLGDASIESPEVTDRLVERFPPPEGFRRVKVAPGSFGEWLRSLPLAAPATPVVSHRGAVLLPADDRRIAAVVAIDVGSADLQQCADAVVRMHAEWSWARGHHEVSYRAASGTPLPFARWQRGERVVAQGASIRWKPIGRPASDHAAFRKYLDSVFAWANTVSIERQATHVERSELRPGDFFILPGNPGHAVLVLDLVTSVDGRRRALLGQSYMPAQSFQVLKSPEGPWFALEAAGVKTPFWRPFPWKSLRRLPDK